MYPIFRRSGPFAELDASGRHASAMLQDLRATERNEAIICSEHRDALKDLRSSESLVITIRDQQAEGTSAELHKASSTLEADLRLALLEVSDRAAAEEEAAFLTRQLETAARRMAIADELADLAQTRSNPRRIRPNSTPARNRLKVAQVRPNLVRVLPTLVRNRPRFALNRPSSARAQSQSARSSPTSARNEQLEPVFNKH